jgi:hypothetical protein
MKFEAKMPDIPVISLSKKEASLVKKLMRAKCYDANGTTTNGRRYPILFRAFVPVCWCLQTSVVLLCRISELDEFGKFEYVIYGDRLFGKGHYPSDSYGSGNLKQARKEFCDAVFHHLVGTHRWVVNEAISAAKKVVNAQ